MQKRTRFRTVNAQTMANHFASLECLFQKYNFDTDRVWNLDETGISPSREARGFAKLQRFGRRGTQMDCITPEFGYTNRVTIMPVVSASGTIGPSLWIFKGSQLPCRDVIVNGNKRIETLNSLLPSEALLKMEAEKPGVNSLSFYEWAHHFTEFTSHLVSTDRKLLLIYDGYRSHMSLRVLEHLCDNNIVAYASPSHTSGRTQQCDTGVFKALKHALNKAITDTGISNEESGIHIYRL